MSARSSTNVAPATCPTCGQELPLETPADFLSPLSLAEGWNTLCATQYKLPHVLLPLSADRRRRAALRLKAYSSALRWQEVFTLIGQSKFLRGLTPPRPGSQHAWRATFDWLIANDTNVAKVLEGQYADKRQV